MMTAEKYNPQQKQIYFKAYDHLSLLEDALKNIKEQVSTDFQISILGQVVQFYQDRGIEVLKDTDAIELYWKKTLDNTFAFGSLYNLEIGEVFIVGALASTFLYEVDGKTLGMLSVGPYGILRGMGASENQVVTHLKLLKEGSYLLIMRGIETELESYKRILEEI